MGTKEELFNKYQKLGNGGKFAVGVGVGAVGGGMKGALGSLMSDNGTLGSGFAEGAAYGGVGSAMIAGAGRIQHAGGKTAMAMAGFGVVGAALFATRIWCISSSLCSRYYGSCWCWTWI